MTSSINPNNIDGTYPIAGQDNDSQGFRDNFTNIKNNFTFAYDELTDLQSKAVLKSALSGGSLNNDMAYAQLVSAQLLKSVETVNNLGTKTGSFTISWADGHFQYYTTSGNTTLAFSNWPTSAFYTKLRLQITTDATTNRTVTFPSGVKPTLGLSDIQGAVDQVVTLPQANTVYLFELTTYDNGDNITIQDLLRNYDIVTTGSSGAFTSLNVSGNVLASSAVLASLGVNGNTSVGIAGAVSGQFHSVIGNITQTSSGGAVYFNTTGNVLAAVGQFGTVNTTGNVLAAGAVLSTASINGNLVTGGAKAEQGLQVSSPTANVAVTTNVNVSRLLLAPTGTVISFGAVVTLPNTTVNGTTIDISSNVATTLQPVAPWLSTVDPSANVQLTAGSSARYFYYSTDNKWFKV